jgi:hypothetical protein
VRAAADAAQCGRGGLDAFAAQIAVLQQLPERRRAEVMALVLRAAEA